MGKMGRKGVKRGLRIREGTEEAVKMPPRYSLGRDCCYRTLGREDLWNFGIQEAEARSAFADLTTSENRFGKYLYLFYAWYKFGRYFYVRNQLGWYCYGRMEFNYAPRKLPNLARACELHGRRAAT